MLGGAIGGPSRTSVNLISHHGLSVGRSADLPESNRNFPSKPIAPDEQTVGDSNSCTSWHRLTAPPQGSIGVNLQPGSVNSLFIWCNSPRLRRTGLALVVRDRLVRAFTPTSFPASLAPRGIAFFTLIRRQFVKSVVGSVLTSELTTIGALVVSPRFINHRGPNHTHLGPYTRTVSLHRVISRSSDYAVSPAMPYASQSIRL